MRIDERIIAEDGTMLIARPQETDGAGYPLRCTGCYFAKHQDLKCPDCRNDNSYFEHLIFKTKEDIEHDRWRAMHYGDDGDPSTYW